MKKTLLLFCILVVIAQVSSAQGVWNSSQGTVTFTKQAFADWTLAANQDRISDSVWLTRASTQSIFNIRKENAYSSISPVGTEWAFGTVDSFAALSYKTFAGISGGSPQSLIGKNLVLHLVAENIYLDFKFLTFVGGNTGGSFSYIRAASVLGFSEEQGSVLASFELKQNYPNPFNPTTVISYQLSALSQTSLIVYDAIGREVEVLVNDVKEAGSYSVQFDATHRTSGIYFARLVNGSKVQVKKLTLVK